MRTTVPIVPPGQPNPQHAAYGLGLVTADTPCGTVWGHGGDTLGTATRDWFTPDGTRGTVAAINTEPDLRQDPSVPAFGQFAQAEGTLVEQMVCQMFGKPVPTPSTSTSTAATRSFAPTPMDFPWRDRTGLNAPAQRGRG
jgi:D-alanyl-D-alanine carboxypeptidase